MDWTWSCAAGRLSLCWVRMARANRPRCDCCWDWRRPAEERCGSSAAIRARHGQGRVWGAMLQVARVVETLRVREHLDLFRSYYPMPLPVAEIVKFAQLEGIEERL